MKLLLLSHNYVLFLILLRSATLQATNTLTSLQIYTNISCKTDAFFTNNVIITDGIFQCKNKASFQGEEMFLGNTKTPLKVIFKNIPVSPVDQNVDTQYLMIAEHVGKVYIGSDSSPKPSPDYVLLENMVTNNIVTNEGPLLTLNNFSSEDTVLGNQNISCNILGNSLVFTDQNTQIDTEGKKNGLYALTITAPVEIKKSLETIGALTINGNLINTNNISIVSGNITASELSCTNLITLGSSDYIGKVQFNSDVTLSGTKVFLGDQNHTLEKISTIPAITEGEQFYFLLFNTSTETLEKSLMQGSQKTIVILEGNSFEVDSLNTNGAATTLQTENLIVTGNIFLNISLLLKNNIFDSEINTINFTFDSSQPVFVSGAEKISLSSTEKITLEKMYCNDIYINSQNIQLSSPLIGAQSSINILCIDENGKICLHNESDFFQAEEEIKLAENSVSEASFKFSKNIKELKKMNKNLQENIDKKLHNEKLKKRIIKKLQHLVLSIKSKRKI